MYLLMYFLGLFTWVVAVAVGRRLKRNTLSPRHSYSCFEEDCDFEVSSTNLEMVNEAVVFHWGEHPIGRTHHAAS